jgi:putative membrane protein
MTPKLSILTIAASLALVACTNDNMSRRDVGSPDTSGTSGYTYNQSGNRSGSYQSGTSGNWNQPSGHKSMTNVSAREGATLSEADKAFIRDASSGGLFEVSAGHKAAEKASDNQVKSLGQRMIDDHTRVNKELTDFASKNGINETPTLNGEQNGMLARLDQLNGDEFDRYYVQIEIDDHRKDIAKYEHEASSANDRDLRDWAGKTVPTLREHLKLFEDRARAMGMETGMGSEHRTGYQPGQNEPTGENVKPSNPDSSDNGSE